MISAEWTDNDRGRAKVRIVYQSESGHVFIETEGNHDGTVVFTAVRIDRAEFAARMRAAGLSGELL